MRVLHVIDSSGFYGAEAILLSLMTAQKRMGILPVLCSIGKNGEGEKPVESRAKALDLPVRPIRMAIGPNVWGAWTILRLAKELDISVIHSHGYKGNILLGFMPRAFRRLPLVGTVHGWTNVNRFSKLRIYEWADRKALRRLDAVVVVASAMTSHKALREVCRQRIWTIPNGVQWPPNSSQAAFMSGGSNSEVDPSVAAFMKSGGKVIGSIGRLSKEKGIDHLLGAMKILTSQGFDCRLLAFGEGVQRNELEAMARCANMAERIMFAGYCSNPNTYLPLFDVFVLPSLTEGMPVTILEAMFAGVPIVASRVGGLPEMLQDGAGGILVPVGDPVSLAAAIQRACSDKLMVSSMVERSQDRVRRLHTPEVMAAGYLKVYQMVSGTIRGDGEPERQNRANKGEPFNHK